MRIPNKRHYYLSLSDGDHDNEDAFRELCAAVAARAPFIVGAGPSRAVGLPDWNQLVDYLAGCASIDATAIGSSVPAAADLQAVCERVRTAVGHSRFYDLVTRRLTTSRECEKAVASCQTMRVLTRHNVVFTTNFDLCLELAYASRGFPVETLHIDDISHVEPVLDVVEGSGVFRGTYDPDKRYVVHLHGSIERPETMVLTASDYQSSYRGSGPLQLMLHRLFSRRCVFVGYSMRDRLMLQHLLQFADAIGPSAALPGRHFVVFQGGDRQSATRRELGQHIRARSVFYREDSQHTGLPELMTAAHTTARAMERNGAADVSWLRLGFATALTDLHSLVCPRAIRWCREDEVNKIAAWVYIDGARRIAKERRLGVLSNDAAIAMAETHLACSISQMQERLRLIRAACPWSIAIASRGGVETDRVECVSIAFPVDDREYERARLGAIALSQVDVDHLRMGTGNMLFFAATMAPLESASYAPVATIGLHRLLLCHHAFVGFERGRSGRCGFRFLAAVGPRQFKTALMKHGYQDLKRRSGETQCELMELVYPSAPANRWMAAVVRGMRRRKAQMLREQRRRREK